MNLVNAFSLFSYCFHLEKGMALHLNKLETPSRKDALSQCYNWPSGSEEVENVKRLQIERQTERRQLIKKPNSIQEEPCNMHISFSEN